MSLEFLERHRPRTLDGLVGNARAKRIVRNMFARQMVPNSIMLYGEKGTGKTSLARILMRRYACAEAAPTSADACGACPMCLDPDKNWVTNGVNFIVRNCAALTMNDVKEDGDVSFYSGLTLLFYDEFQRAPDRTVDLLLTYLEDRRRHFRLIFSTPAPTAVEDALVQRSQRIKLEAPKMEEMVQHLQAVCDKDEISVEHVAVLQAVAKKAENVPREAMNQLRDLLLQSHDGQLTLNLVREVGFDTDDDDSE